MRKLKKWRYYCDYCKKSGASGGHIARHEKHCTMNPDRECGFCRASGIEQADMKEMLKALEIAKVKKVSEDEWENYTIENEKEAIEELRDVSQNCPGCMFAAIRQSGYPARLFSSFDFNAEKESFWADVNEQHRHADYYDGLYYG